MVGSIASLQARLSSGTSATAIRLDPGTEVRAKVEASLPNNVLKLSVGQSTLEVRASAPLPPGTELTLKVSGDAARPQIQLIPDPAAQSSVAVGKSGAPPSQGSQAPQVPQTPQTPQAAPPSQAPQGTVPVSTSMGQIPASIPGQLPGVAPDPAAVQRLLQIAGSPKSGLTPPNSGAAGKHLPITANSLPQVLPPSVAGSASSGQPGGSSATAQNSLPQPQTQPQSQTPTQTPPPRAAQAGTLAGGSATSGQGISTSRPTGVASSVANNPQSASSSGQTAMPRSPAPPSATPASSSTQASQAPVSQRAAQPSAVPPTGQTSTGQAPGAQQTPTGLSARLQVQALGSLPSGGASVSSAVVSGGQAVPSGPSSLPTNAGAPAQGAATTPVTASAPQGSVAQSTPSGTLPPPPTGTVVAQGAGPQATTASAPPTSQPATTAASGAFSAPPGSGPATPPSAGSTNVPASFASGTTVAQPATTSSAAAPPGAGASAAGSTRQQAPVGARSTGTPPPNVYSGLLSSAQSTGTGQRPVTPQLRQAADAVLPRLAEQQAGLSGLFAHIGALANGQVSGAKPLPEPVRQVMQQIFGLRLSTASGQPTGQSVKTAVNASGIFREATMARSVGAGTSVLPMAGDLKSLMLNLRGLLQDLGASARPLKPLTQPPIPGLKRSPQGERPASARSHAANGDEKMMLNRLLQDTDAALSRVRLGQMVSRGLGGDEKIASQGRAMDATLDLPLAIGQETAVMQMQIGRDPEGQNGEENEGAGWRLRFALDLTATGPMEAAISLRGGGTYVSLWVDRPETLAAFSENRETLEASFVDAGLDLRELRFLRGLPRRTEARFGAMVDRQS